MPGERLYGAAGEPQNTTVLMETIYKLKQEIQKSNAEKQALAEQLNCLILLVKRSWDGDHNATLHLGNIVGVSPPNFHHSPSSDRIVTNTPVPENVKSNAVQLWERLAIKLLEQDNMRLQHEIQQRQQLYIERRQMYMDELLETHQKEMSQLPATRNKKSLEEVDRKFMKTYNKNSNLNRPGSGTRTTQQRAKSAVTRTRKDSTNGVELTINDILHPEHAHLRQETNSAFSGLYKLDKESNKDQFYSRLEYDDPNRYKPAVSLFDLDTVFGPDNHNSDAKRPISAFLPNGMERQKPRPKSAGVFLTQKHERQIKFDTTRPVSGKPSKGKANQRKKSAGPTNISNEPVPREEDAIIHMPSEMTDNSVSDSVSQQLEESDEEQQPIRVKMNTHKKRPQHVDKFCNELKDMEEMEKEFRKNTIALQKQLGIGDTGMVF
ncbi:uncharacterized protein LOC134253216 [Saccostrea cucullata]|uniref:uncharacterized protein LOC134253216 n=1 Tax=Saccostrea cuccullata TaxID=36930 RepID=UPI002ED68743